MISYEPLWNTMKLKQVSQYRLLKSGIDNKTLDGLKKGKNITLLTVERLCLILDCTPNDIVEFIPDDNIVMEQNSQKKTACVNDMIPNK